ncbi:hypothetical protein [Aquimarina sp. 2201CG14-23]|uniref:hypothetical protein n=1 Tax=Aquimarina mycalae TaxID=3040073 RepID=UPI002477E97F|nr:hypothetical protein [Aquimarina sp. 2201CG14-23]MDH7446837.1 hypothetical protein [Aquimarina sp. 2201CG14-23]
MIRLYELDFCRLEIHKDYVLAIMHEGIIVSVENNSILIKIAEKHFKKTPFVYITHRINSYSVDPIVYIKTAKIPNLLGFAVVSNDPIQKTLTKYEKSFFNKEFRRFDDIKSALAWKNEMIKKHPSGAMSFQKQKKRII